ncbi:unnamed protein product [Tuber aestivum]|uniref:Uncharacterized protein n=1 Tax=Tuber aestivum TaxID=59557 RepID=A0A292PKG3_9PEZI|nr:unnamed protein product [Tuber aestivum]
MPHITRTSLQVRSGLDDADFDELWVAVRAALLCQENRIGLAGPTVGRGSFEEWVTASLESWAGEMYWGAEARGIAKRKMVWGSAGEDGDREDLVIYIAGTVRFSKKLRVISSTAGRRGCSPAVGVLEGGKDLVESDGAGVIAQRRKCAGLEFSIPYMPPPDEFPRFPQESAQSAPVQRSRQRYPTKKRSAPLRIRLGEGIPKSEGGRRNRGNLTIKRREIALVSKPVAAPPNRDPPAPLPIVLPSHSQLPDSLASVRTPLGPLPPPTLVKYSESSSPQYNPLQQLKTYSSHQVFVTRLHERTSALPDSTLVKLVYVSDAQTLEGFLQKLRQKWSISEVKGVRVEVDGQVFDVDLEEERDWGVVLGIVELVGGIVGVVVCV